MEKRRKDLIEEEILDNDIPHSNIDEIDDEEDIEFIEEDE